MGKEIKNGGGSSNITDKIFEEYAPIQQQKQEELSSAFNSTQPNNADYFTTKQFSEGIFKKNLNTDHAYGSYSYPYGKKESKLYDMVAGDEDDISNNNTNADNLDEWNKFLNLSFAEQVRTVCDLDISTWPEDDSDVQKAKARIDIITPMGIQRMAAALNGKDTRAIVAWGHEFSRLRAETFKSPHQNSIRDVEGACSEIKEILADYENLLRAQRPTGLRGLFARMLRGSSEGKLYSSIEDRLGVPPSNRDYRFYTPQQKRERSEAIMDQIEEYYSNEINVQLDRCIAAEEQENLARECKDLTSLYISALKRNRTRLIEEGAKPHRIDNCIKDLELGELLCESEIDHALASSALHEDMHTQMRQILNVTVHSLRTQMRTIYLQALGKKAQSTDSIDKALNAIIMDKDRARAFADNLHALADKVHDLAGLQQTITNNVKLVLENKKPLALASAALLALPAPMDFVQE